ncbi:MAG: hypothetical protein WCG10_06815 [Chlamydiota bacterium]
MNHKKLSSLAALALVAGTVSQVEAKCTSPSTRQMNSMFAKIDLNHQKMYNEMSCEGQNLAMQLVNQSCAGKNSCAGLNSCKTANNSCAGKGSCKGNSPGPFTDKNKAIEVAKKHMANKRASTSGY